MARACSLATGILTGSIAIGTCALGLTPLVAETAPVRRAEVTRTVYFSAVDGNGAAVRDLTAADVTVKEGGKDRPVASLKAASDPMHVSILVDDGGRGGFQPAVSQFMGATMGRADFALTLLTPQPLKLTDFTTDVASLNAAIMKLGQRGRIEQNGEQLVEAVSGAAKDLLQRKAARPVILVLTNGGEPGLSEGADRILGALRDSGASLNVVYITRVLIGKVLDDGPKNSGGLLLSAGSNEAIIDAVKKIATNLTQQYVLTYTLPDGTKPNEKLQLATTRKGAKLIAPQRIPEK